MSRMARGGSPDAIHPDDATLASWLEGTLPASLAARLETHLESCDECAFRLDTLPKAPDEFLQKLRGAAGLTDEASASRGPLRERDSNLLFGALALQVGLITPQRFADACVLWSTRDGVTLADVLVEQGWVDEEARRSVEALASTRGAKGSGFASAETLSGRASSGVSLAETLNLTPLSGERLRLTRLHSQGGIGQVWRAQDTLLGREVALKELLPELRGSARHRERFFREARVAAQLTHPGTAPVYEYREEGGRCYYTMRFYSGQTLAETIRRAHAPRGDGDAQSPPFERLFPILEQFLMVCDTIAYAHSKGIVHRDLKGENVVLGEFGEVTVIDWGLAKSIGAREGGVVPNRETDANSPTIDGERLGTPGFMAPEQARGDLAAIDERTDVYGLSAVLYEALTGRAPFSGSTANEVMHRVETQPPVRPSALYPDTPEELEAICLRGLAKRKEDRFESAAALRDAVRQWLSGQLNRRRDAERQSKFFALSHDLFVALDEHGAVTQVNPAYERFFGFDGRQSPGQPYLRRVHPDDAELAKSLFRDAQRGVAQRDTLFRIEGADGAYRSVAWTLTRVPGESTIYAVGRPVDEASRERREVDARARFFNLSPNLFVISDERGHAAQVNPAWTRALGWLPEDVVGKPFIGFVHPDDVGAVTRAGRRALLREPVTELPVRMRTREGDFKPMAWTLTRVAGERRNYAIGRELATGDEPA